MSPRIFNGPRSRGLWEIGVRLTLALTLASLITACSGLPVSPPRLTTSAIHDFAETPLAAITKKVLPSDGRSGFQLQPYGPNSFATRIELTKLAVRSLDVQYYILSGDNTGRTLMRALRDAAARGVRVRLLIDDLYTTGEDDLLLGLASHANVEIRLFNPFPGGRGSDVTRFVSSGLEFGRVNRRMHNKLLVADNVAAVAGGRNMADEYVMNANGSNFIDMDTFVAGPVVRDLSIEFDYYWNSDVVFPLESIIHSKGSSAERQEDFERQTAHAAPPPASEIPSDGRPRHPLDGEPDSVPLELLPMLNLPFDLARRQLSPLLWANARVLFDPLTKTEGVNETKNSIEGTVTEGVIHWFMTARHSIQMVSPYFVPSDSAVASLVRARAEGIDVELLTNSLASTDEPWVYVGYWAHVKDLLSSGVRVKEISPSLSVKRRKLGIFGHRRGALHMKSAIVDNKQVFLGSMNMDQRSARLNTELGLIIDSEEMAHQLVRFADAGSSYELRVSASGQGIQWVEDDGNGGQKIYDVPPETTFWQRFRLRLIGPLIPEKQL